MLTNVFGIWFSEVIVNNNLISINYKKMNSIKLDEKIFQQIQKKIKSSSEFSSVEGFVNFVLEEVLKQPKQDTDKKFSKDDDESVKERLKSLGYL
ncbi:hypothetical protein KKC06_00125 [Patescibacteria group bacterium]|nr:hypothetical protein [Patescibacteria group bacterium]